MLLLRWFLRNLHMGTFWYPHVLMPPTAFYLTSSVLYALLDSYSWIPKDCMPYSYVLCTQILCSSFIAFCKILDCQFLSLSGAPSVQSWWEEELSLKFLPVPGIHQLHREHGSAMMEDAPDKLTFWGWVKNTLWCSFYLTSQAPSELGQNAQPGLEVGLLLYKSYVACKDLQPLELAQWALEEGIKSMRKMLVRLVEHKPEVRICTIASLDWALWKYSWWQTFILPWLASSTSTWFSSSPLFTTYTMSSSYRHLFKSFLNPF